MLRWCSGLLTGRLVVQFQLQPEPTAGFVFGVSWWWLQRPFLQIDSHISVRPRAAKTIVVYNQRVWEVNEHEKATRVGTMSFYDIS